MKMKQEEPKDMSPMWLENKHGVVSCLPTHIGEVILSTKPGWKLAEPEEVPEETVYEVDVEMTEKGVKRRENLNKQRELQADKKADKVAEETGTADYDMNTLRAMAKVKGIKSFGVSKAKLIKELGL